MKSDGRIDAVIPWVNGNDLSWQAEKARYSSDKMVDNRDIRFRDWDLMRFWFRGAEKFAPWINTIHFVTWGHIPDWLNTAHPKIHIVEHKDYIPKEYLPTFNSHTIELNFHRISGLSEQFIYFNDDMFLLAPLKPSDFFRDGLPCDYALMNPIYTSYLAEKDGDNRIFYIPYNCMQYINKEYSFRTSFRMCPLKWLNPLYGEHFLRNLLLLPWPRFVGFVDRHLPQPYCKQSFAEAWEKCHEILDRVCSHRFRDDSDVSQYFIRFRQFAEGNFHPRKPFPDGYYQMGEDNSELRDAIANQKQPMICINDGPKVDTVFAREKSKLIEAFESVLPDKSSFER